MFKLSLCQDKIEIITYSRTFCSLFPSGCTIHWAENPSPDDASFLFWKYNNIGIKTIQNKGSKFQQLKWNAQSSCLTSSTVLTVFEKVMCKKVAMFRLFWINLVEFNSFLFMCAPFGFRDGFLSRERFFLEETKCQSIFLYFVIWTCE